MTTLERDVTATRAEFLHGVRLAFPGGVSDRGDRLLVQYGDAAMEIRITTGPVRHIAALQLPTLSVVIVFTAGSPAARQAMLQHMDRAMHRGGG